MERNLAKFVIAIALFIPGIAFKAFILSMFWSWFIEPAFGLQPPGIWVIAGMTLIIGSLRPFNDTPDESSPELFLARAVSATFAAPAVYLFLGWILAILAGTV